MAEATQHPTGALHDAIDGRLSADERAMLDAHLATCKACRRELDALRWTKSQAARARAVEVPGDLDARLREALDAEDSLHGQPGRAQVAPPRPRGRRRLVRWVAAAAALVAVGWLAQRAWAPSIPARAAADVRAFRSGALPLELGADDPRTLEAHLRATAAPTARVYDFRMMGYALQGGGTHVLGRTRSALAAYRGRDGRPLICEMYVGRTDTLPAPVERRTHDRIDFLIYRDGDVTVVFWQEGDVVCVLAGDGDPEAIVALAFAKAVKT